MSTPPSVSVLIVSFNTRDLLDGCLRSLQRTSGDLPLAIIVVDNASTDGSALSIKKRFPEVKVIENERNIGFAAAVHRGMAEVHSQFVFVLNPDTLVPRETIQKLLNYINIDTKCAIVGASLTSTQGVFQTSTFRFPSLFREFWNFLPEIKSFLGLQKLGSYVNSVLSLERKNSETQSEATVVECISGAAFLMRTDVFKAVGGMDERFFLYHEEMDLCTRMRKAGWNICAHQTAQVIHFDAQASGYKPQRLPRAPLLYWRISGMNLLWQKHRSGMAYRTWKSQSKGLLRLRIGLCFLVLPFIGIRRNDMKKRIREIKDAIAIINGQPRQAL